MSKSIFDTAPAYGAISISPDNDNDLSQKVRGLYVGGTGDVKVDMEDGTTVTFVDMAGGIIHPIQVTRVYATGTSATGLIGIL